MQTISSEAKHLNWLVSRTLLLLEDPYAEKYSKDRIIEALNFACLELAMETELIKDEVDMQTQANQPIYDIPGHIRMWGGYKHPYAYPLRIGYEGASSPAILPVSMLTLDAERAVLVETGDPQAWVIDMLSYGEVFIQPIPMKTGAALPGVPPGANQTGNMQVTYAGMPFAMADHETETPEQPPSYHPDPLIPAYYHEYLPFFAARFILDEGNVEDMKLGDQYAERFKQGTMEARSDGYNLTSYHDIRPM